MRHDMAKVVTERPRKGHASRSKKYHARVRVTGDLEDYDSGPSWASSSRRRQYGYLSKEFSDLLGPLRAYLRKQVGRPWDAVWSELSAHLDKRSITGQHIFDHIEWEVERHAICDDDGRVYRRHGLFWQRQEVFGLYVHPRTGLLCDAPYELTRATGRTWWKFDRYYRALRAYGIEARNRTDAERWRIETHPGGVRVWECVRGVWFLYDVERLPPSIERMFERTDGVQVPIWTTPTTRLVRKRQAGKRDLKRAKTLLASDPMA